MDDATKELQREHTWMILLNVINLLIKVFSTSNQVPVRVTRIHHQLLLVPLLVQEVVVEKLLLLLLKVVNV